jgi:hypothetical protein
VLGVLFIEKAESFQPLSINKTSSGRNGLMFILTPLAGTEGLSDVGWSHISNKGSWPLPGRGQGPFFEVWLQA